MDATELEAAARRGVGEAEVRVLEEPEAHLSRAVGREAVQTVVDDQIADVVGARVLGVHVGGRVGVGDVVLVERLAQLPQPLGDVEVILGAAALELRSGVGADIGQDAGELFRTPAARVQRRPVIARSGPSLGVAVELEQVEVVDGEGLTAQHEDPEQQGAEAHHTSPPAVGMLMGHGVLASNVHVSKPPTWVDEPPWNRRGTTRGEVGQVGDRSITRGVLPHDPLDTAAPHRTTAVYRCRKLSSDADPSQQC